MDDPVSEDEDERHEAAQWSRRGQPVSDALDFLQRLAVITVKQQYVQVRERAGGILADRGIRAHIGQQRCVFFVGDRR